MINQLQTDSSIAAEPAVLQKLVDALASEFATEDPATTAMCSARLASRAPEEHPGWCDISVVRPGLFVTAAEVHHKATVERRHGGGDLLKIHLCMSGGGHIAGDHGGSADVKAGSLVCFTQPADSEKSEHVSVSAHERFVTLACTRDFISGVIDNCSLTFSSPILDFARGKPTSFLCDQMPLPLEMKLLAEDLMSVRASPFEQLIKEARSLELLSLALIHISASAEARPLRDRDYDRVRNICEIIEHEDGHTHTITDLSRLVAWNETQMMDCFKKVMGTTISIYRQKHRMQNAMRRLRASNVSITELAFELGYEHPGNFSTAFKNTFGFSPKAVRNGQTV
jgi:AraC-like DNA-binding protein